MTNARYCSILKKLEHELRSSTNYNRRGGRLRRRKDNMNNTLTTVYDLDSLIESFDQSIRRMEEMAKESPIIEDWCQGYADACAEAIVRIRNHVVNI